MKTENANRLVSLIRRFDTAERGCFAILAEQCYFKAKMDHAKETGDRVAGWESLPFEERYAKVYALMTTGKYNI